VSSSSINRKEEVVMHARVSIGTVLLLKNEPMTGLLTQITDRYIKGNFQFIMYNETTPAATFDKNLTGAFFIRRRNLDRQSHPFN
jgi:hypothetical protein